MSAIVNWFIPSYSFLGPRWLSYVLSVPFIALPYFGLRLEGLPTSLYFSVSMQLGRCLLAVCSPLLGILGLLTYRSRQWMKTEHTRGLTIEEARQQHTERVHPDRRQGALHGVGVAVDERWGPEQLREPSA